MFSKSERILVTGSAGFIGYHLIKRLFSLLGFPGNKNSVIGLDNLNSYYDPKLKLDRLDDLSEAAKTTTVQYKFVRSDISDRSQIQNLFRSFRPSIVVNLAAQAGVRYSITNPDSYIQSNIIGFYNILECCRSFPVKHLIYASSSSVYGGNTKVPFSTDDKVDSPVSLYAATKKSDELLAHCYSKLYSIPTTGLRFFTVYGPFGRPDMAYFGFTEKLIRKQKIEIFNFGNCKRDFTYIDDIVEGIVRVLQAPPEQKTGDDGLPIPPYHLFNIGNGHPESLLDFISILQDELVKAGVLPSDFDFQKYKKLVPMQAGDVAITYADTKQFEDAFSFSPKTDLRTGLKKFATWYKGYYRPEAQ